MATDIDQTSNNKITESSTLTAQNLNANINGNLNIIIPSSISVASAVSKIDASVAAQNAQNHYTTVVKKIRNPNTNTMTTTTTTSTSTHSNSENGNSSIPLTINGTGDSSIPNSVNNRMNNHHPHQHHHYHHLHHNQLNYPGNIIFMSHSYKLFSTQNIYKYVFLFDFDYYLLGMGNLSNQYYHTITASHFTFNLYLLYFILISVIQKSKN